MQVDRGLRSVLRATVQVVQVTKEGNKRRGQGLFLNLDGKGYVLTCHHVVAPVTPAELHVRFPNENGELGPVVPAAYEADRSHPAQDAVVLSADSPEAHRGPNPLLHVPDDYVTFRGPRAVTGFGFTENGDLQKVHGEAASSVALRVNVTRHNVAASCCPDPPNGVYRIPYAIRVIHATGAAKGISGSVAECDEGVLGLIHFATAHSPTAGRANFVVPLSAWTTGWDELKPWVVFLTEREVADTINRSAARCLGHLRRLQPNAPLPWRNPKLSWNDEKWTLGDAFNQYRDALRRHAREGIARDHAAAVQKVGDIRFLLEQGDNGEVATAIECVSQTLTRYGWNNSNVLNDFIDDFLLRLTGMRTALQGEAVNYLNAGAWHDVFRDEKYYLGQEFAPYWKEALWEHPDEAAFRRHVDIANQLWNEILQEDANPKLGDVKRAIAALAELRTSRS